VTDAAAQLGAAVAVYLDGGPTLGSEVSTIVDCTGEAPVVLRSGAISQEQIDEVLSRPAATPVDDPHEAIELPADHTPHPGDHDER
jgi:hypothetical protein